MPINLQNRVAIVTGAGKGLGRAHALLLARCGAKVVVNDLGSDVRGKGESRAAAQNVVDEVRAAGGEAVASGASVTDFDQVQGMVADTLARWGRVDILVNNAGILRDRTFSKMELEDFRAVIDVHLMGAVHCIKAVWDSMRERQYGRIILTTSSSGLFGNFGQANYGAAKMALVGLMQTLALEGARYGIHVNCIAPSAATQMTHDLWSAEDLAALSPERVSPAVVALASENAPTKHIVLAGAGGFKVAYLTMTRGIHLKDDRLTAEELLSRWGQIRERTGEQVPSSGFEQYQFEVQQARLAAPGKIR